MGAQAIYLVHKAIAYQLISYFNFFVQIKCINNDTRGTNPKEIHRCICIYVSLQPRLQVI